MIGAIAGDVIGSVYEWHPTKSKRFELLRADCFFTDDTVMTIACAQVLLGQGAYAERYRTLGRRYPNAGYGGRFAHWLWSDDAGPYNSWGNGSAMRVSPVGFACNTVDQVMSEAARSAEVTHNHPEGVKGAQATALAIYMARTGSSKDDIRRAITQRFRYDLERTVAQILPTYRFDESCQGTVPEAIICFLEATGYEDAIRNAISLGGDADTLACITGGIAQAFYGVPDDIVAFTRSRLPQEFLDTIDAFDAAFKGSADSPANH